jgi:ABC-type Fe3+-hydroxamate transport system substrate-binding protein
MPARRVVSLCPSITETLVAIGGYRSLVAATRFCVRPKGMLWGLPRIGGTKNPDVSRILALEPDLVFANEEENRLEDVRALTEAGIEVDVTFPKKVAEVPAAIRRWGARVGDPSEAEALAARIEESLGKLEASPTPAGFSYAYWIWREPWMTISDDTYVADLLRLAGGANVYASEPDRYPKTSPSEAIRRGAEVHFFPSEPYPFSHERHDSLTASLFGESARRLFVEGDDYCWHGARTLAGLERAAALRISLGER